MRNDNSQNEYSVDAIAQADTILLVGKQTAELPSFYIPGDLVEVDIDFIQGTQDGRKRLRETAAHALERLVAAAKNDGITLMGVSGFRSYGEQRNIYDSRSREMGVPYADAYIARAGRSEHQTGLAMDMAGLSGEPLDESFADTPEGQWLSDHCADYGFIIRYPKGKENITGYLWEPWHIRYVGIETAREITSRGITLDEYLSE